ncbi:hypothetical protein [Mycoplasmopsis californica]|nr:hypothetical protein [Mycoplasmopsis californica]
MKRKLILSTVLISSLTMPLSVVSCVDKSKMNDTMKENEALKIQIAKLKNELKKQSDKSENTIKKLQANLVVSNQAHEEESAISEELKKEIDKLTKLVDELDGTPIKTNGKSARELLELINKFLTVDFPQAMKSQKPEEFEKNKSLFTQIINSVKASYADFKDTDEGYKDIFTWQNAILYNLRRSQLVAEYIDNPTSPVTVITPKSELMDELFDWRIKDLERIGAELEKVEDSKFVQGKPTKAELIKRVNDAKNQYEKAKNSATLLSHQIASWHKLEVEVDNDKTTGVINKIVNFSSPQYRSLLPEFNLPDFKISLFPVYKQIIDEEFKEKVKKETLLLNNEYKNWLESTGKSYIYSLRFANLYKESKKITDNIYRILKDDNIDFYNEFSIYEDLDKFILKAKAQLYEVYKVNPASEKAKIDALVTKDFDEKSDGSFAKMFNDKYAELSKKSDDKKAQYLYSGFFTFYSKEIKRIKEMKTDTFIESYDRYLMYLITKKQINISSRIIDLYSDLNEDISQTELKELLNWDNSTKFEKLIKQEQDFKHKSTKIIDDMKKLIHSLKLSTNIVNIKDEIKKVKESCVEIDKHIEVIDDEHEGDWVSIIEKENLPKFLELYSKYKELIKSIEKDNNQDLIKNASDLASQIEIAVLGVKNSEESKPTSLIGLFNFELTKEYFETEGDDYNSKFEIFKDILEFYEKIKSSGNQVKHSADSYLTQIEELLKKVEHIKESGHPWSELFYSSFTDIQTKLKNNLNKVKESLEKVKNSSNNADTLKNDVDSAIKDIGGVNDGKDVKGWIQPTIELIEEVDNKVKIYEKRMKNVKETAAYVPGQEIYILIRYWQSKNEKLLNQNLPDKNTNPDKTLTAYIHKTLDDVRNKHNFKEITGVKPNDDSFDMEYEPGDTPNPKTVYDEFKKLEDEYAEALFNFVTRKDDSHKTVLKEKIIKTRKPYYEFLNGLKERKIYFANHFIKFSADQYKYDQDETESPDNWVASDLLGYYAKIYGVTEVVNNIATGIYYENLTTSATQNPKSN